MSKGKRNRALRVDAKNSVINSASRKAMLREINAELALAERRFYSDEMAVILWVLHQTFGFGKQRLEQFAKNYGVVCNELKVHYEMSDSDVPFIATEQLRRIGIDVAELQKTND